jgi:hypothetical protein
MNRSKKFGLAGLVLAGLVAVSSQGCQGKDIRIPINLPNSYKTLGIIEPAVTHKGSLNVFSLEENLVEKSRMTGKVEYFKNGILNLKTDAGTYLFNLRLKEISGTLYANELFKEGDSVSFPTIREYDYSLGKHSKTGICSDLMTRYRILNPSDYIYLDELRLKN